ncbi:hypothetical protein TrLO_g7546 [Triparma laevis f. longispina]|uniref:Glycerophosphocholine acyltransferase 1 n=1 Tax=Triparma laevis f. longispina TaxID=1714387 RepID=A0A9W6ZXP3_9STRA|nr:hypothetical protein TrLO_g7546 [Triparma laevis f. longispina]
MDYTSLSSLIFGSYDDPIKSTPRSILSGYITEIIEKGKARYAFMEGLAVQLREADPYSAASYTDLYGEASVSIWEWIMVCFPLILVGYFVFTANKQVSALSQAGSLQGREVSQERSARAKAEQAALQVALAAHRREVEKENLDKEQKKKVEAAKREVEGRARVATEESYKAGEKVTEKEKVVPVPIKMPQIHVSVADKFVYSWGVINVALTAYFLGHFPGHFYLWHSPKCIVLLIYRWNEWKMDGTGRHYLFYDFCYWANFLCLYYIWFNPHSAETFKIVFMVANGPLAWAVLAFNNSLIFHSVQHMVSAFIHISPMLLSYCLRWHPGEEVVVCPEAGCETVSHFDLIKTTMTKFYLPWLIFYYAWVFVAMKDRVKRVGATTLFDHVCSIGGEKWFNVISSNRLLQQAVFMLCHYVFAMCTMLLAAVFYHHKKSHFSFVFIICFSSAWNGSNYYMKALEQKNALKKERERLLQSSQK